MESMSHDEAAGAIGSQLVDKATRGLDAGGAAMAPLTALIPAGAEEISAQAAAAFAEEGASMLAWNTAAQEELGRTGVALVDIARMYSQVDNAAADSLAVGGSQFSSDPLAGAGAGAGLMRADTLPGAGGAAARTPLMAQLIEGAAPANPSTTLPATVNAASSAVGAGLAPLSSIGGAAGGGARPGLASSVDQEPEESETDESAHGPSNEQLL
jgi:hypothetical protein